MAIIASCSCITSCTNTFTNLRGQCPGSRSGLMVSLVTNAITWVFSARKMAYIISHINFCALIFFEWVNLGQAASFGPGSIIWVQTSVGKYQGRIRPWKYSMFWSSHAPAEISYSQLQLCCWFKKHHGSS